MQPNARSSSSSPKACRRAMVCGFSPPSRDGSPPASQPSRNRCGSPRGSSYRCSAFPIASGARTKRRLRRWRSVMERSGCAAIPRISSAASVITSSLWRAPSSPTGRVASRRGSDASWRGSACVIRRADGEAAPAGATSRSAGGLSLRPNRSLDYVVAHEVAHLAEMNHGPRFWRLVESLSPDSAAARAWLKRHRSRLFSYG